MNFLKPIHSIEGYAVIAVIFVVLMACCVLICASRGVKDDFSAKVTVYVPVPV